MFIISNYFYDGVDPEFQVRFRSKTTICHEVNWRSSDMHRMCRKWDHTPQISNIIMAGPPNKAFTKGTTMMVNKTLIKVLGDCRGSTNNMGGLGSPAFHLVGVSPP